MQEWVRWYIIMKITKKLGVRQMSLIVQKFGGTSVKDAQRIFNVAKIITDTYAQGNSVVAVVSAQGDTTDDLIAKANEINKSGSSREMDVLLWKAWGFQLFPLQGGRQAF